MSKPFHEMDPDTVRKLLEGHENVIDLEAKREQGFLQTVACPKCGKYGSEARVNPRQPFIRGVVLPNKFLVCLNCETEFDPHTGIIFYTKLILTPG